MREPERTVAIYINGDEVHLGERLTEDFPQDHTFLITPEVWRKMKASKFVRLLYSLVDGGHCDLEFYFRPGTELKPGVVGYLDRLMDQYGGCGDASVLASMNGRAQSLRMFAYINQEEWNTQKSARALCPGPARQP